MTRPSTLALLLLLAVYVDPLTAVRTLSQANRDTRGGVTAREAAEDGDRDASPGRRERPAQAPSTGKRPRPSPFNDLPTLLGDTTQSVEESLLAEAIPAVERGAWFDKDPVTETSNGAFLRQSGASDGNPFRPSMELFLFDENKGTHTLDLNYTTLRFGRDGRLKCRQVASQLPVDPVGAAVLSLDDDTSIEIFFRDDFSFPFSGALYTSTWVSSNGFLSFGEEREDHRASLDTHAVVPRISGLFTDLHPGPVGGTSWKQEGDAVAVTWHDVASFGHDHTTRNTFQIVLDASGEVSITLLHVQPVHNAVVGLSGGGGQIFQEVDVTDLSAAPACDGAALHHHATHGEAAVFRPDTFDLSFTSLKFDASGKAAPCTIPATEFPVDPASGQPIALDDDDSKEVEFVDGFTFPFFGLTYSSVFIGSNGYLTFGTPDVNFYPTLPDHFSKPRISAMYTDMHPARRGRVSLTQESEGVVAITYERVESLLDSSLNSFQIALYASGEVLITYLRTSVAAQVVVGTSSGQAVFPLRSVDFTGRPTCPDAPSADVMWSGEAQLFIDEDNLEGALLNFDLAFTALSFPPSGGPPCSAPIFKLPVDPAGGEILLLGDDETREIHFGEGFSFPFFGQTYNSTFVSSNGYLTFGDNDWLHSVESLAEHYSHPRVAALFADLDPPTGSISWKQLSSEAVAVTYVDVPSFASETALSTFQAVLFSSGEVQIAFLDAQAMGSAVVGLSSGVAPSPVQSVHLKSARGECEVPLSSVSEEALAVSRWTPAVIGEVGFFLYDDGDSSDILPISNSGLRYGSRGGPACRLEQGEFPVDPRDGEELELMDDDSVEVEFVGGFTFPFFGVEYSSVFIGSNGYLTFGARDTSSFVALDTHYKVPRISALFTDLDPSEAGEVTWKQVGEEVFAVTYSNIQAYAESEPNTFQVALYAQGEIVVTYKDVHPKRDVAVGVSAGLAPVYPMVTTSFIEKEVCPVVEP